MHYGQSTSNLTSSYDINNLTNIFGFSLDFVKLLNEDKTYLIQRNSMKKINSANAVVTLTNDEFIEKKKAYEAEDKELYQDEENWDIIKQDQISFDQNNEQQDQKDTTHPINSNTSNIFNNWTPAQMSNLTKAIEGINDTNPKSKQVIKAYRSKLKSKFFHLYELNSQKHRDTVKYKFFHKCCYPRCGRTFSSSGWLKAHFEEHMIEMKKNNFNVLFDKYILSSRTFINR